MSPKANKTATTKSKKILPSAKAENAGHLKKIICWGLKPHQVIAPIVPPILYEV